MSRWNSAGALVLAALALAFPLLVNGYWLSVGVLAMFYAIVAASWALLAGYAGQFSFGHMGFVSLGAYTSGLLVVTFGVPIPLGMAAGVVMCALVGSGIGFVCACAVLILRCSPWRSPRCCASSSCRRTRSPVDPAGLR
jgi:branched-chain amino acid transport system permease protein